jgi:hypothetical protein
MKKGIRKVMKCTKRKWMTCRAGNVSTVWRALLVAKSHYANYKRGVHFANELK